MPYVTPTSHAAQGLPIEGVASFPYIQQGAVVQVTESSAVILTANGWNHVDAANATEATPAERLLGITTIASPAYLPGDVRRYGAVGAGEDNTNHINVAMSVSAALGVPARFAGLTLLSTGGHVQDVSKVYIAAEGARILMPNIASNGLAWTLTSTGTNSALNVQNARHCMRDLTVVGVNSGSTQGLYLNSTSDAAAAAFLNFENVVFEQFNQALVIGNNTYICKFFGCYFSRSATGLYSPNGVTNSSEELFFDGGGFTDCSSIAVDHENPNTILVLDGTSIDGNNITFIKLDHNSRMKFKGDHLECLNIANQSVPMVVINSGQLSFDDSDWMADGTGSATATSIVTIGAGSRLTFSGQCLLNNLLNAGGVFASGAGAMQNFGTITTYDTTKLPTIVGVESNFSLLEDGGFEQSSIVDNIAIVGDVASTVTVTTASPGVVSWSPHRQTANQPIRFSSTGTLPTPLSANQTYYVLNDGNFATGTFDFALSPGGAAVNITAAGSGTLTCRALPVNRITGSHITLANTTAAHNSGAQSLAATLNGGLGATFIIAVPCRPGQLLGTQGYYSGASSAATAFSLTPCFSADMAYDIGGIPIPIGQQLQSGAAVNPSSVPTSFTKFNNALVQAPSWAKWYYLQVNLNNLFNNTLYLDDFTITAY